VSARPKLRNFVVAFAIAMVATALAPCVAVVPPGSASGSAGTGHTDGTGQHDFGPPVAPPQASVQRDNASAPTVRRNASEGRNTGVNRNASTLDARPSAGVVSAQGAPAYSLAAPTVTPEEQAFAYAWAAGQPCFSTAQCFLHAFYETYQRDSSPTTLPQTYRAPQTCEYPKHSGRFIFVVNPPEGFHCP
jgi:hypothetical protein